MTAGGCISTDPGQALSKKPYVPGRRSPAAGYGAAAILQQLSPLARSGCCRAGSRLGMTGLRWRQGSRVGCRQTARACQLHPVAAVLLGQIQRLISGQMTVLIIDLAESPVSQPFGIAAPLQRRRA